MDPARWEVLKDAFAELDAQDAGGRTARLEALAADDPDLAAELARLLTASDSVGDRFDRAAGLPDADAPASLAGQRIGPWAIIREIGRGGMGTVYEAHRTGGFDQQAAFKTIAAGRDSEAVLRRFRHERQILARLEHPNIARLLDGGLTGAGTPYFVMEFVAGRPVDRWCAEERPPLQARVALMRQVCGAVQYAHEHLVVHRDLKPGNILVTGDGTAKLLDFGIAKLLDPAGSDDGALTQTGALPMTAAYASPEQRRGEPISAASDIYSLGVLLYELLAGLRPFPAGPPRDQDRLPPPPSRAAPASLRPLLRGDLDSIVLKALRPEPEARYRSAQALADDLGRYLEHRPVLAASGAWSYRAGKFVRRHRASMAAAVLAVLGLLVATVFSLHQAGIARRQRDRAVREAERTRQVTRFFQGILTAAGPERQGRSVSVVEAIDSAIARSDTAFTGEPDLRAAVMLTLGATLRDMYLYRQARPLLEEAYRLRRQLDGAAPSRDQSDALYDLADIESQIGDAGRAESLYRQSLAMLGRLPLPDSSEIYLGLGNVAEAQLNQGRLADAAALYDTVARALDRLRPGDLETRAITRANRGTALAQLGRLAEAEPELRESVDLFARARGADDPRVAAALQPLAGTLTMLARYAEAESAAARGWRIDSTALGPANAASLSVLRMLTGAQVESGRCAAALPRLRYLLSLRGRELVETDPTLGVALLQLGQCQGTVGDLAAAERTLRDALAVRQRTFPPTHWAIAQVQSVLGEVLVRQGKVTAGRRLLQEGYDGLLRELGSDHLRVREAKARLERAAR